jgi:hypothetical protein
VRRWAHLERDERWLGTGAGRAAGENVKAVCKGLAPVDPEALHGGQPTVFPERTPPSCPPVRLQVPPHRAPSIGGILCGARRAGVQERLLNRCRDPALVELQLPGYGRCHRICRVKSIFRRPDATVDL